jgi:hypothetical protein
MRIFISYRRSDTAGHAGRLFDSLQRLFGHPVFMDVEGLTGGQEFPAVIQAEIERSDVLIALIGPSWFTTGDEGARPRIEDPNDYLRRELETAFAAGVEVIPVLVGGASMPSEGHVPEVIRPLCQRQAIQLMDRHWSADVTTLIETFTKLSWNRKERPARAGADNPQIVAKFALSESIVNIDDPYSTGAILADDGTILVASPASRCLWFIESKHNRVMGKARLRRWPLWKPIAAAAGLGYLWVADARGCAIWRMTPSSGISFVSSRTDKGEWTESIEYGHPTLEEVKGCWLGAQPFAVAAGGTTPGIRAGVWVVVPAPWPRRRGDAGELLRIDPTTLRVVAAISMPKPRQVAIGAQAVWVAAADLLVKVDVSRNAVEQSIPLGDEALGLTVGDNTVWVGGKKGVARIDSITCRVEGRIDTPSGFCSRLALSGDSLWVASENNVHRIHTRTHDLIGSVDISPGERARIGDVTVDRWPTPHDTKVYALIHSVTERSFVSVIAAPQPYLT